MKNIFLTIIKNFTASRDANAWQELVLNCAVQKEEFRQAQIEEKVVKSQNTPFFPPLWKPAY